MTLYFDAKRFFPPAGNPNVYYVDKRTAIVYTYKYGKYIQVPVGAENHISPNYKDAPPPKPEFMIMFELQGGTGGPASIEADVGTLIEYPQPDPTYTGSIFQGWFDASTGGNEIIWPYKLLANVYMYAQWVVDPNATPTP
jgi:hypothetical protein